MVPAETTPADPGRCASVVNGYALCRIRELLALAAPHCPPGLIDRDGWSRLATLPTDLPAASSIGAFECRLEAGATQVDFEVCIRAEGGGRAALAAGLAELTQGVPADDARWQRTLAFLRAWTDPTSVLFNSVPVIWLEFDLDATRGYRPAPFVVLTIDPEHTGAPCLTPRGAAVLSAAHSLLGGRPGIDPAVSSTLERALHRLSAVGRLTHLALRPCRGADILRLIVRLPWQRLTEYLDQLDWPGSRAELHAWLAASCQHTIMSSVNLDIGETFGPNVGIEYYFPTSPAADPRWGALFDTLESAGACTRERRAQLVAYASQSDADRAAGLLRVDRELLIKVSYQTGAPLRAKAYLPFRARANIGSQGRERLSAGRR